MPDRVKKVKSLLKRQLALTFQRDLSDPRIQGMISITHLKVTDDLKQAFVYISVLPKENEKKVLAALTDGARHIQKQTQQRTALRVMPRLSFRLDHTLKKQADIFTAIHEANERTGISQDSESQEELS